MHKFDNKKIVVILPAYNEEITIEATIKSFASELPQASIIVVDNNSSDKTNEIAESTLKNNNINGIVISEKMQGKGFAVRRAFSEIDADIYIMSDADLTYPANEIHKLLDLLIDNQVDMVVGDRHLNGDYAKENKRNFHEFGNKLVKNLINFIFKSNLNDIMSGYRVFNKKFVKNYPILVSGFQLETDMTLHALDKRFKIIECSINFVDRPDGSFSKLNTFSDGFKVIFTILNVFRIYRPLKFFTFISSLFLFLTLLAGLPVVHEFVVSGKILHIPLAILSVGLGITTVLSFAIGLILDSITHQHKSDFEFRLLNFK